MKAYFTLCYSIKHEDVRLLQNTLQKVNIIMQVSVGQNPRYFHELLWQLYVIDTTATDSILPEADLTNTLVNQRSLSYKFYKMDLSLKNRNDGLKRFQSNPELFLQETDQMFGLHTLSVDTFAKIRQ